MKRAGFTMIELIFVIVILGILAAVAVPKLAATRDDAAYSAAVANVKTCVSDVIATYQSAGDVNQTTVDSLQSCTAAEAYDDGATITVTYTSPNIIIAGSPDTTQNTSYRVSGTAVTR